jgi:tetratricopeptide (TPR) repeat protein
LQHAHYFAGVCCRKLGQYDNALAYYQTVVDSWPDYQFAWSAQYLIGICYENLIKSGVLTASEAGLKIEESYKAVAEKYPNSPLTANACMKLSDLNLKRGQLLEVCRYLELFLLNAHPSDPRIENAKARLEELVVELEGEAQ